MSNWKKYKIEEVVADFIDYRGKTPSKVRAGIPLITAKIVKGGRVHDYTEFIPTELYQTWMTRGIPQYDDVLLTTEAPLGEVALLKTDDKVAIGQRLIALRGKQQLVSNVFLKYNLETDKMQGRLHSVATGTTVVGIKSSELKKVQIDLPDLPTQARIASILSSLDDKIELNRRINKTLEEIARTLFKKYFLGCSTIPLNDAIELNPRLSLAKGKITSYVDMANLPADGASIKAVMKREFNGGSKFENLDTLLARITPCLENGKTAFVDVLEEKEIGFGSTEFIVMRPRTGVSPYYVYLLARTDAFRDFAIKSMVGTSGRQRVQTDVLFSYQIPLDMNAMAKFHTFCEPLFEKIKINSREIRNLSTIRDTLLPKLMSGEIDVTNIKDPNTITTLEPHEQVLS